MFGEAKNTLPTTKLQNENKRSNQLINFTRRRMLDTVATHPKKFAFGWPAMAHI